MRATYAVLLVGSLLAGTMLVPYDFDADVKPAPAIRQSSFFADNRPQIPPGMALVPFPDYWAGAKEVTLFHGNVYLPAEVALSSSPVPLRLPTGMLVFPGARWLNISIEAPTLPADVAFDFEYTTADDRRGVRAVPNKGTYSLALEERMNDWSPDTHTRWSMAIVNHAMEGVNANVTVVVARPLGTLPGHILVADRWNGQDTKTVYSHKDTLSQHTIGKNPLPMPNNRGPASSVPLRGVPALELQELQVHLYYNSTTSTDAHFRPLMAWNSPRADGYGYDRSNIAPTHEQRNRENGHFFWQIPVTPEMYDTVQGSRSRWQITINWYGDDAREYWMEGDYHFHVVAHRVADQPHPELKRA